MRLSSNEAKEVAARDMIVVFVLSTGRSGTKFLSQLFHHNARDCVSVHEPYFNWFNRNLFGPAIYEHSHGDLERIRRVVERKQRTIRRYGKQAYVECNHAFLKSFYDVVIDFFPGMKLIHLIRNPLKTARSETNRELKAHEVYFPFRNYRGPDGKKYFRWSLTGHEPIYRYFDGGKLTLFQRYVIQWIEVENRAMCFLKKHGKSPDCFTIDSPAELNDPVRMREMFDFLNIETNSEQVSIEGRQNRTPGKPTVITDEDRRQFREVVETLPEHYLEIFQHAPYADREWIDLMCLDGSPVK